MTTKNDIFLSSQLREYILEVSVRENDFLKKLREETSLDRTSHLQSTPEQTNFICFLAKLINAKKILEIGTYSGYTTLALALATSQEAQITTCDLNKKCLIRAQKYWSLAKVTEKISLRIGPAINTIEKLLGENEVFDLIFIDADKSNYLNYYELSLKLLYTGGLIIIDNTLWNGDVINPDSGDKRTRSLRELNETIKKDTRVDVTLLPVRDGISLIRKR